NLTLTSIPAFGVPFLSECDKFILRALTLCVPTLINHLNWQHSIDITIPIKQLVTVNESHVCVEVLILKPLFKITHAQLPSYLETRDSEYHYTYQCGRDRLERCGGRLGK